MEQGEKRRREEGKRENELDKNGHLTLKYFRVDPLTACFHCSSSRCDMTSSTQRLEGGGAAVFFTQPESISRQRMLQLGESEFAQLGGGGPNKAVSGWGSTVTLHTYEKVLNVQSRTGPEHVTEGSWILITQNRSKTPVIICTLHVLL